MEEPTGWRRSGQEEEDAADLVPADAFGVEEPDDEPEDDEPEDDELDVVELEPDFSLEEDDAPDDSDDPDDPEEDLSPETDFSPEDFAEVPFSALARESVR